MFAILSPLKIFLLLGASAAILVGGGTMSSSSKHEEEIEIKEKEIKKEQEEDAKASEAEAALLVVNKPAALSDPIEIKDLGNKISNLITQEKAATKDIKDAIVLIATTETEIINITQKINDLHIKINDHHQKLDQAEIAHSSAVTQQTIQKSLLDGLVKTLATKTDDTKTKTEEKNSYQEKFTQAKNAVDTQTLKISELEKALNVIKNTSTTTQAKAQEEKDKLTSLNETKTKTEQTRDQENAPLQAAIVSAQNAVNNYSQPITPDAVDVTTKKDLASKLENAKQALSIKKTKNQQLVDDATEAVNQQQSKLTTITNKIEQLKKDQKEKQATLNEETAKLPALKDAENNADQELSKKESFFLWASIEESEAKDLKDAQQKISENQDKDVAAKKKALNELKHSTEADMHRVDFSYTTQSKSEKTELIETKNQTITTQEQMLKNFSSEKSELINQQEVLDL